MKKTTKPDAVKSAKDATPATSAPSPTKTKSVKPKAEAPAPVVVQSLAPPPVVQATPAPVTAPAKVKAAPVLLSTTIVAQIDVGFGNTLFIRGDGPELSWEKGLALDCVADDKWSIVLEESAKPIVYKFLLNDETWCKGEDHVAQPGTTATVSPVF